MNRAALVLTVLALAGAQDFRSFGFDYEPAINNVRYDGRFTFARLKFTTGPGGYYYRGLPAWAHGYNNAEENLSRILEAVTCVPTRTNASNVFALDDPGLTRSPIAYMTEAGFWVMNDTEAIAFRAYLHKGGFVIFDDFRPPPRGGGGWDGFEEDMRRVLPDARIVDLAPSDPIFHVFFDIDSFDILPQAYDGGAPIIRGIYEDNDRSKRLVAIINFNTDVSQYWEFSGEGFLPVDESNEAYKLGVNYIVYGLTH